MRSKSSKTAINAENVPGYVIKSLQEPFCFNVRDIDHESTREEINSCLALINDKLGITIFEAKGYILKGDCHFVLYNRKVSMFFQVKEDNIVIKGLTQ